MNLQYCEGNNKQEKKEFQSSYGSDLFRSSKEEIVLSNYIGRQKLENIPAKYRENFDEFHHDFIFKISPDLAGRALNEGPSLLFNITVLFNKSFPQKKRLLSAHSHACWSISISVQVRGKKQSFTFYQRRRTFLQNKIQDRDN